MSGGSTAGGRTARLPNKGDIDSSFGTRIGSDGCRAEAWTVEEDEAATGNGSGGVMIKTEEEDEEEETARVDVERERSTRSSVKEGIGGGSRWTDARWE
jgi:hypothetical protein